MKYPLTILALGISSLVFGADSEETKAKSNLSNLKIGINASPEICYRRLFPNPSYVLNSTQKSVIDWRNNLEIIKVGYALGINVNYSLKKFVSIETGIGYSNLGYQTKKVSLTFSVPDPREPTDYKIVYSRHHIDIPLKVNFFIGKGKVRFLASAGIIASFAFDERATAIYYFGEKEERQKPMTSPYNFNNFNLFPVLGIGFDYQITKHFSMRVAPTFRYGILKTINTPLTEHIYSGGLGVNFLYGF